VLKPQLKSVTALNERYYVSLGTAKATAMTKLPTSTTVKDELGGEYTVELKNWVCSTYNANSEADYPASATYDLPVEIKDNTEVSKTVNTMLSVKKSELKRINPVKDIQACAGLNEADIKNKLGGKTTIVDTLNDEYEVDLTWDLSSCQLNVQGTYDASATFTLPANVKNTEPPMSLTVSARVTIVEWVGSGTVESPYIIETYAQLEKVKDNPSKHFKISEDVLIIGVPNGIKWTPIGTAEVPFTGSFEGSLKNLYFSSALDISDKDNVGFFGVIGADGIVKNLNLNFNLVQGKENVGGLAGINKGTIENCAVTINTGSYNSYKIAGQKNVGIMVGYNEGTITDSIVDGIVLSSSTSENNGGFVGYNNGTIRRCDVASTKVTAGKYVGGFVGLNEKLIDQCSVRYLQNATALNNSDAAGGFAGRCDTFNGSIQNSYVKGSMTWNINASVGPSGFISSGNGATYYCYASVTGADGPRPGTDTSIYGFSGQFFNTVDSYWDGRCQNTRAGNGGQVIEADKIALKTSYKNWDFGQVWFMFEDLPFFERNIVKFEAGDGSAANPYEITTADQLMAMRFRLDKHYILKNDIDLSTAYWIPIGKNKDGFIGVFDASNKTLRGLTIENSEVSEIGLFGCIGKGTVKNLVIENFNIAVKSNAGLLAGTIEGETVADKNDFTKYAVIENIRAGGIINATDYTGGIVGKASNATMNNIESTVQLTAASGQYNGGIAGKMERVNMQDVSYNGTLNGSEYVGGIAGYYYSLIPVNEPNNISKDLSSQGSIKGQKYVGGMFGTVYGGLFENLLSLAGVESKFDNTKDVNYISTGGIAGMTGDATFTNLSCTGEVKGYKNVGGLFGIIQSGTVLESEFSGGVSGKDYTKNVGGVCGWGNLALIERCASYNFGLAGKIESSTIKNSYSSTNKSYGGALIAYDAESTRIENCYSEQTFISYRYNGCTGTSNYYTYSDVSAELAHKKTEAEMKNQATYVGWDFTNIWKIDPAQNNGYPTLR